MFTSDVLKYLIGKDGNKTRQSILDEIWVLFI